MAHSNPSSTGRLHLHHPWHHGHEWLHAMLTAWENPVVLFILNLLLALLVALLLAVLFARPVYSTPDSTSTASVAHPSAKAHPKSCPMCAHGCCDTAANRLLLKRMKTADAAIIRNCPVCVSWWMANAAARTGESAVCPCCGGAHCQRPVVHTLPVGNRN